MLFIWIPWDPHPRLDLRPYQYSQKSPLETTGKTGIPILLTVTTSPSNLRPCCISQPPLHLIEAMNQLLWSNLSCTLDTARLYLPRLSLKIPKATNRVLLYIYKEYSQFHLACHSKEQWTIADWREWIYLSFICFEVTQVKLWLGSS